MTVVVRCSQWLHCLRPRWQVRTIPDFNSPPTTSWFVDCALFEFSEFRIEFLTSPLLSLCLSLGGIELQTRVRRRRLTWGSRISRWCDKKPLLSRPACLTAWAWFRFSPSGSPANPRNAIMDWRCSVCRCRPWHRTRRNCAAQCECPRSSDW